MRSRAYGQVLHGTACTVRDGRDRNGAVVSTVFGCGLPIVESGISNNHCNQIATCYTSILTVSVHGMRFTANFQCQLGSVLLWRYSGRHHM